MTNTVNFDDRVRLMCVLTIAVMILSLGIGNIESAGEKCPAIYSPN